MEAKDLRIGNIVGATIAGNQEPSENVEFWRKFGYVPYVIQNGKEIDYSDWWIPIPLTEEWLVKFGFRKNIGWYKVVNKFNTLELSINNDNAALQYYVYFRGLEHDEFVQLRKDLMYIHQLQNLYHALTSQELEAKQS